MTWPVDIIFPPKEGEKLPFYRIVLRSISQLCFQSNELTGFFFLIGAFVASPIAGAYLLTAAILGPLTRRLLGEKHEVLKTGLPGLNPALISLSLPVFFDVGWTNFVMWAVLVVCIIVAVLMVKLFLRILPFPQIALPFLIIFWVLWALEPHVGFLEPSTHHMDMTDYTTFHPAVAVLFSLGQAIFSASLWSGVLFLIGMFLSQWRYGVVALLGAVVGTLIAYYYRHVSPEMVDMGLYGFNAVLAAVGTFIICGNSLRLSVLSALLATILIPIIGSFGLQTLSAPFNCAIWTLLILGWVQTKWFQIPPEEA